MDFHLVVTNPFGAYAAGDVISDPDLVGQLTQTHDDRVVKIAPLTSTSRKED